MSHPEPLLSAWPHSGDPKYKKNPPCKSPLQIVDIRMLLEGITKLIMQISNCLFVPKGPLTELRVAAGPCRSVRSPQRWDVDPLPSSAPCCRGAARFLGHVVACGLLSAHKCSPASLNIPVSLRWKPCRWRAWRVSATRVIPVTAKPREEGGRRMLESSACGCRGNSF